MQRHSISDIKRFVVSAKRLSTTRAAERRVCKQHTKSRNWSPRRLQLPGSRQVDFADAQTLLSLSLSVHLSAASSLCKSAPWLVLQPVRWASHATQCVRASPLCWRAPKRQPEVAPAATKKTKLHVVGKVRTAATGDERRATEYRGRLGFSELSKRVRMRSARGPATSNPNDATKGRTDGQTIINVSVNNRKLV